MIGELSPRGSLLLRMSLGRRLRGPPAGTVAQVVCVLRNMDLLEGCTIVVLLNTATDTARLVHGCSEKDCPAFSNALAND
jgi:hypothetical protein